MAKLAISLRYSSVIAIIRTLLLSWQVSKNNQHKKRVTEMDSGHSSLYVDPNKVFYISCRLRRQLSIGRRKEMTAAPSQNQLT